MVQKKCKIFKKLPKRQDLNTIGKIEFLSNSKSKMTLQKHLIKKPLIHARVQYLFQIQDAVKKYHFPETIKTGVEMSWSARKFNLQLIRSLRSSILFIIDISLTLIIRCDTRIPRLNNHRTFANKIDHVSTFGCRDFSISAKKIY